MLENEDKKTRPKQLNCYLFDRRVNKVVFNRCDYFYSTLTDSHRFSFKRPKQIRLRIVQLRIFEILIIIKDCFFQMYPKLCLK
jgi:hypothetical protein